MKAIATLIAALITTVGLAAPAHAGEVPRVVAFGDSIAYGIGTEHPRLQAWPKLIGARREAVRSSRLVSPGVDGIAAVDRYRRDVLRSHHPDVAILAYGMNDLTFSSSRKIVAGIKRIQRWNTQRGVVTLVTTVTPVGADRDELEPARREVNALIRKTFDRAHVVDFDRVLLSEQARTLAPRFDCGDAIHPNALGYRKMARLVSRHLHALRTQTSKTP